MFPDLDSSSLQRGSVAAQYNAGEFGIQLVGKFASFTQEFQRNRVDLAVFVFDEDPNMLVRLELLGKFFLHSGSAGGGWCGGHVLPPSVTGGHAQKLFLERRLDRIELTDQILGHRFEITVTRFDLYYLRSAGLGGEYALDDGG